jgi:hypothetical protein
MVLVAHPIGKDEYRIAANDPVGHVQLVRSNRNWFRSTDECWNWTIIAPTDASCSGTAPSKHEAMVQFRDAWMKLEAKRTSSAVR